MDLSLRSVPSDFIRPPISLGRAQVPTVCGIAVIINDERSRLRRALLQHIGTRGSAGSLLHTTIGAYGFGLCVESDSPGEVLHPARAAADRQDLGTQSPPRSSQQRCSGRVSLLVRQHRGRRSVPGKHSASDGGDSRCAGRPGTEGAWRQLAGGHSDRSAGGRPRHSGMLCNAGPKPTRAPWCC